MKVPWPSLMGVWSLIWRATFFAPLAGVMLLFWCAIWIGRYLLPVAAGILAWNSAWLAATATVAAWLFVVLLAVRQPWFKLERRDFPNLGKNV